MKILALAIMLICFANSVTAESAPQIFEGRLTWSCLGNWFHEKQTDKNYALIFNDATIALRKELSIPTFPTASARSYDIILEGIIEADPSCYPKTPCDWRNWPGRSNQPAGCIYVKKIIKLNRK